MQLLRFALDDSVCRWMVEWDVRMQMRRKVQTQVLRPFDYAQGQDDSVFGVDGRYGSHFSESR